MTNEELAMAIQDGQTDLIQALLDQNKPLLEKMAWKKANSNRDSIAGFEDFLQAGYLALIRAVKYYDREQEYPLIAYLKNTLKTEYRLAAGMRVSGKNPFDPCANALSIDAPISNDEPNGVTLGDMTPDPASEAPFESVENESERKHMRSTLDTVAGEVLNKRQLEEYNDMLMGECCKKVAENKHLSQQRVSQRRKQMLEVLRGDPRVLQLWLDLIESQESVGDIALRYASSVGVTNFKETGASSVEHAVERILRNEKDRRAKAITLENALEKKLHSAWVMAMEADRKRKMQQMRAELAAFEQRRASRRSFPADAKTAPLL